MYHTFNSFYIRTPSFSFNSLEEPFEIKIRTSQVQEAIYLASPILHSKLQKYLDGTIINAKEKQRIELALYRYISRMSSRCTPFGLFAGCSIGDIIGDKTNIILGDFYRHTRLDMYFLCALSQELSKLPDIKENIRYYPNTTLYQVGEKYRYIEYKYVKFKRIHQISSVNCSIYLNSILKTAKKGIKIGELLSYLVDNNIEPSDARRFIDELIDSQILVSELSPSVTGNDYFIRITRILEKLNINKTTISFLKKIQKSLYQLDFVQEDHIRVYQSIVQNIKQNKFPHEENFLFQVDMTKKVIKATLGKDVVNELQSTLTFLNKITFEQRNKTLDQFKQAFHNRYESKEISLMEALDPDIGIGYPVNKNIKNSSPLLEGIYIPDQINQDINFQSNTFLSILFEKTVEALKQNKKKILLDDNDIKKINTNWNDLPPTIYSMFEILKPNSGDPLIHLTGFHGTCGANLFARFAHTDENTTQLINKITIKEQELMSDVLLAEIAHLPDSRIGNVLSRPHIRDYEILYLANSDLPENRLIYMSDLFISIKQGRIFLRSKKLNKEIVPRLTNAHNFRKNSMPVYHFLCDIQKQHGRIGLFFDWGYLKNMLSFLPRIQYRNTILSLATWNIKVEEIKHLLILEDNDNLIAETRKWRSKYPLPQKMLLPDSDNKLLIDWENERSIKSLFSIIKNRSIISLTEFIYEAENSVVKDEYGNSYANECIVVFYKNKKK